MLPAHRFEDLKSWQKAREMTALIYKITNQEYFRYDRVLREQMRGAALSIMANIAEGFERNSRKEYIQFLYIAKASAGELRSHLYAAKDQAYLSAGDFEEICGQLDHISRMLSRHILFLKSSQKTKNE